MTFGDLMFLYVAGFAIGYFVLGEWFCGTVLGMGRQLRYPWEKRSRRR
jgi:hypothetical protein